MLLLCRSGCKSFSYCTIGMNRRSQNLGRIETEFVQVEISEVVCIVSQPSLHALLEYLLHSKLLFKCSMLGICRYQADGTPVVIVHIRYHLKVGIVSSGGILH